MSKYNPPEGYLLDLNSGLYYTQVIAEDESGNKSQVVTWFNADTGEYRQDVYPIKGSAAPKADEKEVKKKKKSSKLPILIPIILLALIAGAVALGYFKLGWFDAVEDTAREETGDDNSTSSQTADSSDSTVSAETNNFDGAIEIFVYDDGFITLVAHTDRLYGPHIKHLSFHAADYSISVDDWDDSGSFTQCSVWKRDDSDSENISYKYFKDANYNINGDVIAIESDISDIPDLNMYSNVDSVFLQVEYYEGEHPNIYQNYDVNSVVSFVNRSGN